MRTGIQVSNLFIAGGLAHASFFAWETTGRGMANGEGEVQKLREETLDLIEDDWQSRGKETWYLKRN